MKYLIVSDIHGSSTYLNKLLSKIKSFDKLVILGDILYHGPRNNLPEGYNPKDVINILNDLKDKIIAVRGNCDAKVDLMVLDFKIEEEQWLNINDRNIVFTHGDVYSKYKLYPGKDDYVMIYGHYHINEVVQIGDISCINLGSLSIPKDGKNSYGILTENGFKSYHLDDDNMILEYDFK